MIFIWSITQFALLEISRGSGKNLSLLSAEQEE
jgi:hypothetical protein